MNKKTPILLALLISVCFGCSNQDEAPPILSKDGALEIYQSAKEFSTDNFQTNVSEEEDYYLIKLTKANRESLKHLNASYSNNPQANPFKSFDSGAANYFNKQNYSGARTVDDSMVII